MLSNGRLEVFEVKGHCFQWSSPAPLVGIFKHFFELQSLSYPCIGDSHWSYCCCCNHYSVGLLMFWLCRVEVIDIATEISAFLGKSCRWEWWTFQAAKLLRQRCHLFRKEHTLFTRECVLCCSWVLNFCERVRGITIPTLLIWGDKMRWGKGGKWGPTWQYVDMVIGPLDIA